MHHQTTVEEQVEQAQREQLRAEIAALKQDDADLDAKYPNHTDMPDAAVRRSLYLSRRIGELYIELGECRYCGEPAMPAHAYCGKCVAWQRKIADEILAEIHAEEEQEK